MPSTSWPAMPARAAGSSAPASRRTTPSGSGPTTSAPGSSSTPTRAVSARATTAAASSARPGPSTAVNRVVGAVTSWRLVATSRRPSSRDSSTPMTGWSLSRASRSARRNAQSQLSATTRRVAERGSPSRRASSPTKLPGPSAANGACSAPASTSTCPETTRYIVSAASPCRKTTSPRGWCSGCSRSATASSAPAGRLRKKGIDRSCCSSTSAPPPPTGAPSWFVPSTPFRSKPLSARGSPAGSAGPGGPAAGPQLGGVGGAHPPVVLSRPRGRVAGPGPGDLGADGGHDPVGGLPDVLVGADGQRRADRHRHGNPAPEAGRAAGGADPLRAPQPDRDDRRPAPARQAGGAGLARLRLEVAGQAPLGEDPDAPAEAENREGGGQR